MEPKVSVIVPVYKAENYLHRCVDSLLAQTFQDYEILLVDDGSPDRSGEICDEYAKKDSRVRVFHKANGGVSSARQCGMDNARGEYTIHADPDDWVEPEMLEELYKKAKEDNADIVVCDFYEEYIGKQYYRKQQTSVIAEEVISGFFSGKLHAACWNKLIKKKIYIDHDIQFPLDIGLWEDMATIPKLFYFANRIAYKPFAYYHYVRYDNPNSYTRNISIETLKKQKYIVANLESFFRADVNILVYINYLKLNIRMSLYKYNVLHSLHIVAYPESNNFIWKHPNMSFPNKMILWLESIGYAYISNCLYSVKMIYGSLVKNVMRISFYSLKN